MVGTTGFEPAASWSQTRRDTKLRHVPNNTPTIILQIINFVKAVWKNSIKILVHYVLYTNNLFVAQNMQKGCYFR